MASVTSGISRLSDKTEKLFEDLSKKSESK